MTEGLLGRVETRRFIFFPVPSSIKNIEEPWGCLSLKYRGENEEISLEMLIRRSGKLQNERWLSKFVKRGE